MVSLRPNQRGIERLRNITTTPVITEGDKQGPLLIEMDRVCSRQFMRAFTSEGYSTGAPWAKLSTRYAAYKRRAASGARRVLKGLSGATTRRAGLTFLGAPIAQKILVWTGETREAFTSPSATTSAGVAHVADFAPPFTYRFGAVSEKAWRHEHGQGEGNQKLPVRSVVRKTAKDIKEFQVALVDFYLKRYRQLSRAGFTATK